MYDSVKLSKRFKLQIFRFRLVLVLFVYIIINCKITKSPSTAENHGKEIARGPVFLSIERGYIDRELITERDVLLQIRSRSRVAC